MSHPRQGRPRKRKGQGAGAKVTKGGDIPEVYLVDTFVIETYASIDEVPYATVSKRRGKNKMDPSNIDELHRRCRICFLLKSNGETLTTCTDCRRTVHSACLLQFTRKAPRNDWRCPQCTADHIHRRAAIASAVRRLREGLTDIQTRPGLPPKLQLKLLNVASPTIVFGSVHSSTHSPTVPEVPSLPLRAMKPGASPPKFYPASESERRCESPPSQSAGEVSPTPVASFKRLISRKRTRCLLALANDLQPVADRVADVGVQQALRAFRSSLPVVDLGKNHLPTDQRALPHDETVAKNDDSKAPSFEKHVDLPKTSVDLHPVAASSV